MHFFESRLLAELVLQTFGRAFKLAKETVHSLDALAGQDFLQTVTFCPNKSWTKLVSKFHNGGHLGFFCLPRSHLEFYPVCSATPSCTILGVGWPHRVTACLFKELMHIQICFYIVYKSVLSVFTQEFSLVVWLLMCNRKNWSVLIFLGLSDRP